MEQNELDQHAIGFCAFLSDLVDQAPKNNVQIFLDGSREYITVDNNPCNGIFVDTPTPQLIVACKKPEVEWIPTLIHESCHMDQWVEQTQEWAACKVGAIDKMELIQLWIAGYVELNSNQLDDYIRCLRNIELDCEKRAVAKINKYNIGINVNEYIQRANAYVMFYNVLMQTRKWYTPGLEPYNIEEIWRNMPNTWLNTYEPILCKDYIKLFN